MSIVMVMFFFVISTVRVVCASDLSVDMQRQKNGAYVVHASTTVAATTDTVWEVITDFENLPRFVPIITSSKVVNGEPLRLSQTMEATFRFIFRWTKSVQITCDVKTERSSLYGIIAFQSVGGSDFKSLDGVYTMQAEDNGVKISLHIIALPNFWAPSFVGNSAVKDLTEKQLSFLAEEIEKREAANRHFSESILPVLSSLP